MLWLKALIFIEAGAGDGEKNTPVKNGPAPQH